MSHGRVYVIGEPHSSMVKIGVTHDVLAKRLREIQMMCPVRLKVRWSCPGAFGLENKLHRHFAPIRSHGEWFEFGELDPVETIRAVVDAGDQVVTPRLPPCIPHCASCGHSSPRHSPSTRGCCVMECPCVKYVKGARAAPPQWPVEPVRPPA
ncbi:GIY-YIG nuclease family protein [Streptomyces parvulus]|uniref:GIY-YIG nuclease family protein n=1 Tax=Streptomyces parvulus TaxID=146923 RepID=UPI0033FC29A2